MMQQLPVELTGIMKMLLLSSDEKEENAMKLTIRKKMFLCALLPISILGIIIVQSIRSIESKTQELEKARKEMIGTIAGLSDIAESNVTNTQETNGVITNVSERFREVKQSAAKLKGTADILEQNIRNFKM